MSSDPFEIKQGDTLPVLVRTLKGANGSAINLTTASSVTFRMKKIGATTLKVERVCTIDSPATNGQVSFAWQEGDTDTPGVYEAEFGILFGTDLYTVPNNSYMTVTVTKELG